MKDFLQTVHVFFSFSEQLNDLLMAAGLAAWPAILSIFLMFAEGKDDLRRVIESLDQFAPEEIDRSRVVIIGKEVTTGDRMSSVY